MMSCSERVKSRIISSEHMMLQDHVAQQQILYQKSRDEDGKACWKIRSFFKVSEPVMPDEIPHSPTSSQTCGYQDNGCVEIQKSSLICPSENFESESRSGPDESDSTMSSTSSTLSIVPDQRKFASDKYECLFPRLYFSSSKKNGYVCKYFELFSS